MATSGILTCCPARSRGICTPSGLRTLAVAVALPVLAGACVATDATTPLVPSTLNAALGDVAHPALDWASGFFSGRGILTPAIVPTRCPFDAASQYFVCSPLTGGDLTLNQRFTLLDAGGARQSAFDAPTTTGLHLENSVASSSASVDGQQVLDLTGLGTPRHTLNGTSLTLSSYTYNGSPVNEERRTTVTDLVLPVVAPSAPIPWPLSGTIDTRSRAVVEASADTIVFIATMRFDGSSLVTLTYTVPGGIRTCRVDLTSLPGGSIGCGGANTPPIGREALMGAKPALR